MLKRLLKSALGWEHRTAIQKFRLFNAVASIICWLPLPLRLLLRLFGSDKDHPEGHQYGAAYTRIFDGLRYNHVKLLEIGIAGGASLLAWRAYFPRGKIVACDIVDMRDYATKYIHIYQADQSKEPDLLTLKEREGPFDVIIDDGSHFSRHQLVSFDHLFSSLKNGGFYIIEDVMTSLWTFDGWDGAPIDSSRFKKTCLGFFLGLAPYLNADEFETPRGVDHAWVELASKIGSISFEKNMIIIERRNGSKGVSAVKLRNMRLHQVSEGQSL